MNDGEKKVLVVEDDPAAVALLGQVAAPAVESRPTAILKKLELKPHDVLVVRVPAGTSREQAQALLKAARAWLAEEGLKSVRVMVLEGPVKLEALNEEQMAAFGWVRVKRTA